uniref:Uncharacterized protein n=1 Tax=Micrurus corallinus TaxID=54390 RepID=A0A2D4FBM5_MICCO
MALLETAPRSSSQSIYHSEFRVDYAIHSAGIFRHSVTHQATNSWQEQFQIQSPEIHRAQFMLQKKNMARNRFSDKYLKLQENRNNTILSLKFYITRRLKLRLQSN